MIDVLHAFPTILRLLDADGAAAEQLVFVAWRRSVDGAMAENVVPVRMDGKRLITAVPNETWRRQVADLGPAMAAKLNFLLGTAYVSFIEFQIDPSAVQASRSRRGSENLRGASSGGSFPVEIDPELQAAADAIQDESLRSTFLAAAAGSLARNERHGS
jgi:hypothetical protein